MNPEEQILSIPARGSTTTLHFDPARHLQVTLHIDTSQGIITLQTSGQDSQVSSPPSEHPDDIIRDTLQRAYVEQEIAEIFAAILELPRDDVESSTDFFACGGDSLATVAVVAAVEEHFHIHIDPVTVFDHPVISDLAVIVLEQWEVREDAGRTPGEEVLS